MTIVRIMSAALVAAAILHPAGHPALANQGEKGQDEKGREEKGQEEQGRNGKPSTPPVSVERTGDGEPVIVHEGEASFYGGSFHGKKTASGEPFDQNKPTAASRELPLGAKATVTNQENGKSVDVIVNDRGPYVSGRVIDLSRKAAKDLDMIDDGTAPVRVEAKPSDQPNEQIREKVEAKAESAGTGSPDKEAADKEATDKEAADKTQVAEKPERKPDRTPPDDRTQAGESGGGTVTPSGSGE